MSTTIITPREIQKIRLEASTKCQLKCPNCPTGAGAGKKQIVGWGNLSAENFSTLLDRNPQVREVELSNWGEMFLNKELIEIMRYAHEKDVALTAMNGTNFNSVSEALAEGMVKYRFNRLRLSIDGATPQTYAIFRRNGDFNRVIRNIETVNKYKAKYDSAYPQMYWVFIRFSHNQHEIPSAREHAERLGMRFKVEANHDPDYDQAKAGDPAPEVAAIFTKDATDLAKEWFPCYQMWREPQINFDGHLLGCCHNTNYGHYGNVFESGLLECLEGELYEYAKGMLLGANPERPDIPCAQCPIYHCIKSENLFDVLQSRLRS